MGKILASQNLLWDPWAEGENKPRAGVYESLQLEISQRSVLCGVLVRILESYQLGLD
jgi:hypothetical protein